MVHDQTSFLNDASFNDFIRNTLGSNDEHKHMQGVLNFDSQILKGNDLFDKPSKGEGVNRGSSDLVMFSSGAKRNSISGTKVVPSKNKRHLSSIQQQVSQKGQELKVGNLNEKNNL